METNTQTPAAPPIRSTAGFGDIEHADWRYSVKCCKKDRSETIVATGLSLADARGLAARLDAEYRRRIEATGQHYSSWTADLHECQLESPNNELSSGGPADNRQQTEQAARRLLE
jgi:hypothetical protein